MFEHINLLSLAQAYSLLYNECFELGKQLVACLKIDKGYIIADDVEKLADHFSIEYLKCDNLNLHDQDVIIWLAYDILMSANEKEREYTEQEKFSAAMRCFVLGSMKVKKRDAVLFLHKNGYTLKKEIKGISKTLVDDIIHSIDINRTCSESEKDITHGETSPRRSLTPSKKKNQQHGADEDKQAEKVGINNPLDYGRLLCDKGYSPSEKIAKLKEKFPRLKTPELGAYARGYVLKDSNKDACRQWYKDNKNK